MLRIFVNSHHQQLVTEEFVDVAHIHDVASRVPRARVAGAARHERNEVLHVPKIYATLKKFCAVRVRSPLCST